MSKGWPGLYSSSEQIGKSFPVYFQEGCSPGRHGGHYDTIAQLPSKKTWKESEAT
jgi:hypothetical protein